MRLAALAAALAVTLATAKAGVVADDDYDAYTPLSLTTRGAYAPQELQNGHWLNATCTAGAFIDFFIDVDATHIHDNLFLEVFHDAAASQRFVKPDSLRLSLFIDEIPADRKSDLWTAHSPDRTYSLAVNAHEIVTGRYFASVQCGDEDASFGIFAEFAHAELNFSTVETSHICANELLYHMVNISEDILSSSSHLKF
mmetsp:Transcript_27646/g.80797  ORF Transcript_27646/g.80797 Transcript_27646/m.80797 type:complete len:198 (-) Transcript_27646:12-605(-)